MKNERKIYTLAQRLSSLLMILTLLWLTVSISFVYTSMDDASLEQASTTSLPADNEEESANPFGNNTEEKNPGSTSFSEEFLHHSESGSHFILSANAFGAGENASLYVAFNGELLVPPPNLG